MLKESMQFRFQMLSELFFLSLKTSLLFIRYSKGIGDNGIIMLFSIENVHFEMIKNLPYQTNFSAIKIKLKKECLKYKSKK